MKTLKIDGLTLDKCVRDAQDEQLDRTVGQVRVVHKTVTAQQ